MNSIRVRLLVSLLAMLAVSALVMAGLTYRNVLAETEAIFDYQLRQMAFSLRDQGEIAPAQAGPLSNEQLDFVIQIWTPDGRSIYASRAHPDLPARALLGLADVSVGGVTWRTFSVATNERVIQVAQPREIRRRLAADAALHSVAPLVIVAPMLALAIWWLAALTLQPLDATGLPDEVAPLVSALNSLLHRLGSSLEQQRAFVSDAAHELRSPLTALKLQLRVLQRSPDEAARAEAIASLNDGIDRAARLVEQLLALARSEPGAPAAEMRDVALVDVVRQAVADTVPLAQARGSELELFADAPVTVRGDAAALGVLARNLVDNAVRYARPRASMDAPTHAPTNALTDAPMNAPSHAPTRARIEVRVSLEGGVATLHVDDNGPGLPVEERGRVFDRFYRHAAADTTGSGLGLAIVRGVAQRHGASVTLGDSPLGGLRATVRFGA